MSQTRTAKPRWLAYALILCLLTWSLVQLVMHRQGTQDSPHSTSAPYWFLIVVLSLLTAGWAVGGFLLLLHWQRIKSAAVGLAHRSRLVYWALWLVPALLWSLAFVLYRLAVPFKPSLVDGPILVLVFWGLALLLFSTTHLHVESDEKEFDAPSTPAQASRLDSLGRSVPATLKTLGPILVISATTLLVFRDSLFDPESIVVGLDVYNLYYMFEGYVRETLYAGQVPLWNPYIFSGSPAAGHPQYLVFYPPQMLLRLLPLNLSLSWAAAFHLWLAGIGMFALCRRLGLRPWIALTCGLVFMLNSGLLLRIFTGHPWLVYALAWFPLAWLLIMIALETGRALAIVGAAVSTSMIILTGHPSFPIYILIFFALYWLYACLDLWRKTGSWRMLGTISLRFIAIIALAAGLSAIQLLPSVVMVGQTSVAGGYGPDQVDWLALSVPDLLATVIPQFYLAPGKRFFSWDAVPYMGVLFILLLPFVFMAKSRKPLAYFVGAVALFSLALAFGESIGLFSLLYFLVPPFRVIRIPPRALVMWITAIAVLGGMGLQTVSDRAVDAKWFALLTRVYAASVLFILGTAVGHWLNRQSTFSDKLSAGMVFPVQLVVVVLTAILILLLFLNFFSARRRSVSLFLTLIALPILGCLAGMFIIPPELAIAGSLAFSGLLLGANALLVVFLYNYGPAPLTVLLLLTLVFLDLGSFGLPYIRKQPPPVFYQEERVVLRSVDLPELARVASMGGRLDQYMLGPVAQIDGYNTGILEGYDAYLRAVSINPPASASGIVPADLQVDPAAMDFLGVEYIITTERFDVDDLELIAQHDDFYLYGNPSALPRAFVLYDVQIADSVEAAIEALAARSIDYGRTVVLLDEVEMQPGRAGEASVSIDSYTPSSGNLSMSVYTSEPGVLVMSEPYYSERRVWVDGQEAELLRANIGFSAVSLPAGMHKVELRYTPTSLYGGAAISALALMICAGLVVGSHMSARRTKKPASVS